jgi:hypothetical protein
MHPVRRNSFFLGVIGPQLYRVCDARISSATLSSANRDHKSNEVSQALVNLSVRETRFADVSDGAGGDGREVVLHNGVYFIVMIGLWN